MILVEEEMDQGQGLEGKALCNILSKHRIRP